MTGVAPRYELVLVHDGSRDKSWPTLSARAAVHPEIHALDLMRNYGQHNALLAGIRAAQGEVVVTMDDELPHPPEELPVLLAKLGEGYDVAYGSPEAAHGPPVGLLRTTTASARHRHRGRATVQTRIRLGVFGNDEGCWESALQALPPRAGTPCAGESEEQAH